jgi:uncharacterized protein (TIGR02001 family)
LERRGPVAQSAAGGLPAWHGRCCVRAADGSIEPSEITQLTHKGEELMSKSGPIAAALAVGLLMLAPGVFAEEEEKKNWLPGGLSGNVAFVTDYSFRGISQTGRDFAIQGGIDWAHEVGVYLGVWASSVKFRGDESFLEQDFYAGYAGSLGGFTYDFSAVYFLYPKEQDYNYWEFVSKFGYDFEVVALKLGFLGSPDYFGLLGTGFYTSGGFVVPIPVPTEYFDLSFDANAGWTKTEQDIDTDDEYIDWNAGITFALPFNLFLDFRYVGTDADIAFEKDAGDRFIFGAKYKF